MKKLLFILFIYFSYNFTAELNRTNWLILTGQNGAGGYSNLQHIKKNNQEPMYEAPNPSILHDLSQNNCQKLAMKSITRNNLHQNENLIIHGTSQGGGTALHIGTKNNINYKALIVESPLVSGNSTILHTLNSDLMSPGIKNIINKLPYSYYYIPYVARIVFPYYSPAGEQAIFTVDKLRNEKPIIILASKHDPQISFQDAQALYYGLRANNKNAYLFLTDTPGHFDLLNCIKNEERAHWVPAIQRIIKNQALESDRTQFQPDHAEFKELYDNLIAKEQRIRIIDKIGKFAFLGIFAVILYRYFGHHLSHFSFNLDDWHLKR